ncbi:MAG: SDR family oxidoreductase [Acidobacteria bacterium]|nr:SDR family oxidoreductase [Acidobacteriota bacterium]
MRFEVNAERPARFLSPYCVAKAGIDMLVRTAADELGPAGIRVNAVRPGLIPTDLSADLVANDEAREDFQAQMPLRRLGTLDDVAAAVVFLSCAEATWITGVCLNVDGGHHLRRGQRMDAWVRHEHSGGPEDSALIHTDCSDLDRLVADC